MLIGCLCIHGFTGAPYEVEPLVDYLKKKVDWLFSIPTLPGHGEALSLRGIQFHEWIECAEKELALLFQKCEKVYLIGFSMGGLIASYLAVKYPVDKLVLLSAAAYYLNLPQLKIDIKKMILDSFHGKLGKNELFHRYQRKIRETPFTATIQFKRLVSFIRPFLCKVKVPTFIAQGKCDGIVPTKSAEFIFQTISATQKKLVYIDHSKHHICYCEENEALFSQVLDFLE